MSIKVYLNVGDVVLLEYNSHMEHPKKLFREAELKSIVELKVEGDASYMLNSSSYEYNRIPNKMYFFSYLDGYDIADSHEEYTEKELLEGDVKFYKEHDGV